MLLFPVALIISLMAALGVASAFFSATETSLFSLPAREIKRLREILPARQGTIDLLFSNPRRLLSMILLADTLANLPLCLLGLYLLDRFSTWRASDLVAPDTRSVPILPAALGLYALVVGVCDLLPKVLALRQPMSIAPSSIRALHRLQWILNPACGALQYLSERLADLLTPPQVSQPLQLSEAEFEALVEVGAEEGALRDAESEMIQEIIKLGDKTAKDCMTPRVEIFGLPDDLTNPEAVARLRAQRRRRVPVYGDTPDEILGILDTQKFLALCAGDAGSSGEGQPHYSLVMDPPSYVSETMRALDLLRSFVKRPQGMAVVVDEYGGTEGIVTLADITEEIVGDALPGEADELYIEELDEDRLLVGGHARLDDISDHEGFEMKAEGLDTISGLLFNRLGYLPKPGDVVRLRLLTLTIRRVTRKRITEVLIEKADPGKPAPAGGQAIKDITDMPEERDTAAAELGS